MTTDSQERADADAEAASYEVIARMLREYVDKMEDAVRRRQVVWTGAGASFSMVVLLSVWTVLDYYISIIDSVGLSVLAPVLTVLSVITLAFLYSWRNVEQLSVDVAAWQLRRIYSIGSRMVDAGRDMHFAQRMELLLKLGEAQFLLKKHERKISNPLPGLWQLDDSKENDEESTFLQQPADQGQVPVPKPT